MQRGHAGRAKMACFLLLSKLKMQDVCRESQKIRRGALNKRGCRVKSSSLLLGENIVCDAHNLIFLLVQTWLLANSCRLGIQPDRQRGLCHLSQVRSCWVGWQCPGCCAPAPGAAEVSWLWHLHRKCWVIPRNSGRKISRFRASKGIPSGKQ